MDARIREVAFRRFQLGFHQELKDAPMLASNAEIESIVSFGVQNLILQLRTWALELEHPARTNTFRWPITWWDHFKQTYISHPTVRKWIPGFILDRFSPPEFRTEIVEHGPVYVCPHADVKWRNDVRPHVVFMESALDEPILESSMGLDRRG